MNRREFLSIAAGAAVYAAGCRSTAGETSRQSKRPNIIMLVTDDHRADALRCAGNRIIRTPNMDALAAGGVRFSNAFVTTSICASSRASIFSGQWTSRHGIRGFNTHFSPEALGRTYPMVLREAGYRIGFIGKYGVGPAKDLPIDEYDYWRGFPGQGKYEHTDEKGQYKHLTQIMGEQAVEFLRGSSNDRPFCLSVSFKAPHVQDGDPRQFIYDRAYSAMYKDVTIPTPETAEAKYFDALPGFLKTSEARRRWEMRFATPEKFQESVKSYYRLITGVDVVIGRMRGELEKLGMADNTVIMLIGDNGFYLGEYGLAGKWFPHELSIRVPLIVYDPRTKERLRGRVLDEMALNTDIAPTILDLAGLSAPAQMQGRSLLPLVRGKKSEWRKEFFYEHPFEHKTIARTVALRTGRYKYARYIDYDYEELFDLESDPAETKNLAKEPSFAKRLAKLRERCNKLGEEAK